MDYSAQNTALWSPIIQIGLIALVILIANAVRRKVSFVRSSMIPTAVLAGFILLFLKLAGIAPVDEEFSSDITYHCIALGFIALCLRVPEPNDVKGDALTGLKSGSIIVGSYMIQALVGLIISVGLALTVMPGLFHACGILLPMGYGQGPGQANNVGLTYEALGFEGGQSFGLSIAAAGYLCACTVGVFYIAYLQKKGKVKVVDHDELSGSVTIDIFQAKNELPISESIDRASIQVALILIVYVITYLLTAGVTGLLSDTAPGIAATINPLLWGFNFMIGAGVAVLFKLGLKKLNDAKIVKYQYQNNYLLNRISGLAFDIMIVSAISTINISKLSGLWVPFILMAIAGAVVTLWHLQFTCKRAYGDYYYEGLVSMYGMMTGTISSGIILLREIDPEFKTPAANNLVVGSSFAIALGFPLLILVGIAPKSITSCLIVMAIILVYYLVLLKITCIKGKKERE